MLTESCKNNQKIIYGARCVNTILDSVKILNILNTDAQKVTIVGTNLFKTDVDYIINDSVKELVESTYFENVRDFKQGFFIEPESLVKSK